MPAPKEEIKEGIVEILKMGNPRCTELRGIPVESYADDIIRFLEEKIKQGKEDFEYLNIPSFLRRK
jgi:hypothetical protein